VRHVGRKELRESADAVRELALMYSTRAKGELPVDRIFLGYVTGKYGKTRRQHPVILQNKKKRIDFLIGGRKSGTYVELVLRKTGEEWRRRPNRSEMNKLIRVHGRMRALVIVDVTKKIPLTQERLKDEYVGWKSTRGRYTRRNITVVYAGADGSYSFGLKTGKGGELVED
jgi:hypothetical protein